MHFAVDLQPGGLLLHQGQRVAHLHRRGLVAAAEAAVREQGRLGLQAEAPDLLGGQDGDLGQLLGRGVVVDVGVHQEHLAVGQHQPVHAGEVLHPRAPADDRLDVGQVHRGGAPGAADHAVDLALVQQHARDERQATAHLDLGELFGHALALHHLVVGLPEVAVAAVVVDVDDLVVAPFFQAQAQLLDAAADDAGAAHQHRAGQAFVGHHLHGAQHAAVLTLGVGHALGLGLLGHREDGLHHRARGVDEALQLVPVGHHVGDRPGGHARGHGRLGHRRGDLDHQSRVEGLGNQVFRPEGQVGARVGRGHHIALLGSGQLGDGPHRCDLHLVIDGARAAVQRAAEDVREAQDVVDLVRVVGAAGGHDGVVAHRLDLLGHDLRRRVGQREDQRLGGHRGHHVGLEHAASRQAQEDVRPGDGLAQAAQCGGLGELRLVRVHQLGAALVDHAGQVGHPDVLARQAQLDQQVQAGQRGRAGTRGHQLDLLDVLAHHLQAVEQGGAHHDGRAVLIVMEHGDGQALAQLALDVEAVRRLDVFQVDAAEGGLQRGDHVDQLVQVVLGHFQVEDVDAGELLEQHALAFHHRLGGQRADVAQAQHRGAVGHHGHQVAPAGVAEGVGRVFDNLLAGRGHARRIGQGQVTLVDQLLGRADGHLARGRKLVVLQRGTAELGLAFFSVGHREFLVWTA